MRRWPMTVAAAVLLVGCGCDCKGATAPLVITTVASGATTTSADTTTSTTASPTTTIPSTYVVQKGDRLADIAKRFGLSVEELAAANKITNPDKIRYGQTLVIPKPGTVLATTTTQPVITPPTVKAPPATTIPSHPVTSKA